MWGAPGTLDRGAAHARVDTGPAVARGVGRERGCGSRASRFRRAVDAAALRARDALSRPRARSRRKRPGARAAARLEASVGPRAPNIERILERAAFVEDGLANWPPEERERWRTRAERSVCSGATERRGSSARPPTISKSRFSLASAELTWVAGAHRDEKGASICHGTAGNGYALLKAFARTGDVRWLERARRFAVHALAQMRRQRYARGRGRYSLLTGDLGVALYLADCLDARTAYPVLDA